ncbi:MAG: hypothetical protein K0Q73_1100 [Paenibacillus sp.]|jgi:hypothetical protein|nr:hypothetical protein [Paenibacillus sp.]
MPQKEDDRLSRRRSSSLHNRTSHLFLLPFINQFGESHADFIQQE